MEICPVGGNCQKSPNMKTLRPPKTRGSVEFCAEYLKDTPAYVAIDFDYKTTDGRDADKVILLSWIPDTAKIKQKMSYAGTKEAVKSALVGVALNINATDLAEAGLDALTEACNKV